MEDDDDDGDNDKLLTVQDEMPCWGYGHTRTLDMDDDDVLQAG